MTDQLRQETAAERTRLADLMSGFTEAQWSAQSLCDGWRVREVVAHMTMQYRIGMPRFLLGFAASGFNFNKYAAKAALADTGKLSDNELLTCLRENINHPWSPPGGGPAGALSHDVIHGLDITEALGLPGPPTDRVALVLANSSPKSLAFFGIDLGGRQLCASDADVSIGTGIPVEMTAKDILLTITGRRAV